MIDGTLKVRVDASTGPNEQVLANSFAVTEYPSMYLVPRPSAQPQKVPGLARVGAQPINLKPEVLVDALGKMGLPGARGALVDGARRALAGDYGDARKQLTHALEIDPGSAEALYWRGWAAIRDADARRAIDDLRLAIRLDPAWPFSYTELARAYGQGGRLDEAIKTLDQLVAAAPGWNQSAGLVLRGEMYTRKGDRVRAAADLKKACEAGNALACQATRP
jgi:pentatricopeptide repeat protein